MAGTPVTINLGGWGGSGDDSAVEQLVKLLNELVDDLETFRAAMATANGAAVNIANLTARRVQLIEQVLQSIGTGTPDTTPASIAKTAGDAQTAVVRTAVTTPLGVTVANAASTALAGIIVEWATASGGILSGSSSITDASGVATMPWTLGGQAGEQSVVATVSGIPSLTVTFTATGTAGAAARITANSPTDQSAATSAAVASDPSVLVVDADDNPVEGETVTFAVTAGGGARDPATVDTGADGIATLTSWTLGGTAGLNTLTATLAGATGSPVTFNANAVASPPTQIDVTAGGAQTGVTAGDAATATVVTVTDAADDPVEGVTVAATITAGNGTLDVTSAVTDAAGEATFTYTTHTTVETATLVFGFDDGAVTTSTTIASAAGTAAKLVIATQPASNGSSGTALPGQPIIHVTDANDNVATGATNSIAAAIGTGNATVSAGSPKAAVAGIAAFTALTLNDTDGGANTVVFSTAGLTSATSTGVTLAPPIPVGLVFVTQPGNGTAGGNTLSCGVWVVDDTGTVVPGANNAVTVALTSAGGAVLSGTLTVNASSGLASFAALGVDLAGSYTLTATSTGLTSAVSTSFTISAVGGGSLNPNMPATITTYRERFWNAQNDGNAPGNVNVEGGWFDSTSHAYPQVVPLDDATLLTDLTAGQVDQLYQGTASRVGKSRFTGAGDGKSPTLSSFQNGVSGAGFNSDEVYASLVFAPSLNWDQITSYKLFQFSTHTPGSNANSRVGIVVHIRANQSSKFGDTTTPLTLDLVISVNSAGGTTEVRATPGTITRGAANHIEVYCKLNTNGQLDGICKMWFNGVLVMDRSNLGYRGGSGTILSGDEFYLVNLYSSKGGPTTSDTIAAPCSLYYGYLGVGFN